MNLGRENLSNEWLNPGREEESLRCLCGSLLARLTPEGVELKCKRCKRFLVVPLSEDPELKNSTVRKRLAKGQGNQ